ncbi:transcription initiation factor TFIID [Penicillium macrosclerotiorum]|uniref:transcription initiation factor TFIID n=1 Tax=Penicillium macrosclerotiorum TaxID=303699 RepID=UPI0025489CDD|nr:transcription initiation factor TFIID [Penicillium macrosclerotiorum]KAJ5669481.1 transcription initiation factor TFIID [Penicillium macrosclerotiorum]
MPHATKSAASEAPEDAEFDNVMRQLNNYEGGPQFDFLTRDLDVGEKADDAVDYEDFDDDDLPEEEEVAAPPHFADNDATHDDPFATLEGDDGGLFGTGDDIFGGADDGAQTQEDNLDDLFGEEPMSPPPAGQMDHTQGLFEDEEPSLTNQPVELPPIPPAPEPQDQNMEVDDDELLDNESVISEEMDESTLRAWKLQQQLFAMSGKNDPEHPPAPPENHEELLHSLFPGFDRDTLPRWLELIPHKKAFYLGKQPLKVPKPVLPTKVNIELAPDQERVFRTGQPNKRGLDQDALGIVLITEAVQDNEDAKEDFDLGDVEMDEILPGGFSMQDLRTICADWDVKDEDFSTLEEPAPPASKETDSFEEDEPDWLIDANHPSKKRKTGPTSMDVIALSHLDIPLLDDPEQAVAQIAKKVTIDLNDPNILVEELRPEAAILKPKQTAPRTREEVDVNLTRRITQRYNISNDQAYDMLKQNHQNKIRSTLGNVSLEHALPALRLQWPYYKTELQKTEARSFHRPAMHFRVGQTSWFKNTVHFKRKHQKGKDAKALYNSTKALSMGDNSSVLLVEYSEEAPFSLSNFGMCNRFINYYRRKGQDDANRPKCELGETAVLLPQDKSPFSIFGHVDPGETTPAISNSMYRAPLFPHQTKPTDFLVIRSTTGSGGMNYFLRNIENFFVAGQQFPSVDIPGPHSRKVTTVAKNRMKMLVYRLLKKSPDERLSISDVTAHIPGTTDMQNRQKVKDFLQHDKDTKYWKPLDPVLPDQDTIRSWVQPEDVCLLESMQVGQQHLHDTGFGNDAENSNENDEDEESESFEQQMAPWKATRNFLLASQGKAMLKLHGEGDPTGRGEGFNFIKTSMKGGFKAIGESVEDKLDAQRLKELGGHSYNVARQQKSYETSIRRIWDAQKASLSSTVEHSDEESDMDQPDEDELSKPTPRSEAPTPGPNRSRYDDETTSQFSRMSFTSQKGKVLRITRQFKAPNGEILEKEQLVWDPRVIRHYIQHRHRTEALTTKLESLQPTGDPEVDARNRKLLEAELIRLNRNKERRFAREKQKGIARSGDSPADGKPTGTQRKCANCGQVGHIKTNKKLCPLLNGTMKPEDRVTDSAFSMSAPVL